MMVKIDMCGRSDHRGMCKCRSQLFYPSSFVSLVYEVCEEAEGVHSVAGGCLICNDASCRIGVQIPRKRRDEVKIGTFSFSSECLPVCTGVRLSVCGGRKDRAPVRYKAGNLISIVACLSKSVTS
jgi:hypothetical protein